MVEVRDLNKLTAMVLILVLGCGLYSGTSSAQTQLTFTQTTIYDQNIFRNNLELPDWVNQTMIHLDRQFNIRSSTIRAGYTGDINFFQTYEDRLFHTHRAGIESFIPFSSKFLLNAGGEFGIRKNKSDYDYYDYHQWLLYSRFRVRQWQTTPLQFEFQTRTKDFKNLREFSYREMLGSMQIKRFFPTKTTFIGQITFSSKKYLNEQRIEEFVIIEKDTLVIPGHGRGRGPKHPITRTDTSVIAHNMNIPETRQWLLSLRIAQSIFSGTGISLQYSRRFKPTQNTRYLQGQEYTYSKDDELYDDPYSYGSHEIQSVLTQLLPWKSQLKIFAEFYDKNYTYSIDSSTGDDESINSPKRFDRQTIVGLYLSKKFGARRLFENVELYFSAFYLENRSNDPYFDFSNYSMNGGIEITF
ncbi:hypothetical protein GF337_04915 [candidate division KSB1 bacterium]|nr:hypothetical protein [candidate division KSB1 bacterium]